MHPVVRQIRIEDNPAVARLIRTVMPEFGAGGQGFAIHDKEVDDMFTSYQRTGCAYFVCEENGKIIGGAGIGTLPGAPADTCELKKMYFLPEGRGRGLGQKLLETCLETARETFNTMTSAMRLYERNGFEKIPGPLGNTGHFACDRFYLLKLGRI
jgi:putative acetyltransferase